MKRHGFLFEDIVRFENLVLAAKKAMRGKKHKQAAGSRFYFDLENEILALQEELLSGTYRPGNYRVFEIREPKPRKICASRFRDRVVHHAICNLLEPHFERRHVFASYACRTGKGSHAALRKTREFARRYRYFLKADIQKYFESIDHDILKVLLRRLFKDRRLLALLDQVVDHAVPGNPTGKGVPIGNLTSQHFANLYLGELDHFLKERLQIKGYVRYMDDFILFDDNKEKLGGCLEMIRRFLKENLALQLKEKVTRIAPVTEGVPFLGFRVYPNLIRLQRSNWVRTRTNYRRWQKAFQGGQISENELAARLRSSLAHISHANTQNLRRKEFAKAFTLA